MVEGSLTIQYGDHARVQTLRDHLHYFLEEIALGFERWGEDRVYGPGAYLALAIGPTLDGYADPMGKNRWPTGASREPFDGAVFLEALNEVAYSRDGAIIVSIDGVVSKQLVRFRTVEPVTTVEYAPWMGSRHMSALDISTRPDIVSTLTLSQETGRITIFNDGTYQSIPVDDIGARWAGKSAID